MSTTQTEKKASKPTHTIRIPDPLSTKGDYVTIGVGWKQENGTIACRPNGKILLDGWFYVNLSKNNS